MNYIVSVFMLFSLVSICKDQLDFDQLMERHLFSDLFTTDHIERGLTVSSQETYDFFKNFYDQKIQLLSDKEQNRIPQIIHQIWLGSPVPPELKKFQESWQQLHPTWQYLLWTDKDIITFGFENIQYIKKSTNYAERSDMMRYEILHRHGGVYVDMDQRCLRSFDALHRSYDFYVGIQPLDTGKVQLGTGVIGSVPGHPLLRACIDGIAHSWQQWQEKQSICERTGPLFFTRIFIEYAHIPNYRTIALPSAFFYPMGSREYEYDETKWIEKGAYAVHYWAKTWLHPRFRRPEFKSIKNY